MRRIVIVAPVLAGLAAACFGGRPSATPALPPSSVPAVDLSLPPADLPGLAPLIDPLVRPLELRLARGALVDRTTGAPGGGARHLAVYVEPVRAFTDAEFVQAIVPLARTLTPFLFRQWPGLESYDVCQEPSPGVDDRPEPETQTVLDVSRAYAETVDWERVLLQDLVADTRSRRPGIIVAVASRLVPALEAAR